MVKDYFIPKEEQNTDWFCYNPNCERGNHKIDPKVWSTLRVYRCRSALGHIYNEGRCVFCGYKNGE